MTVMKNHRHPHPTNTLWDAYVSCGLDGESLIEFAWRIVNPCPSEFPEDGGWLALRSEVAIEDASTYLNSMDIDLDLEIDLAYRSLPKDFLSGRSMIDYQKILNRIKDAQDNLEDSERFRKCVSETLADLSIEDISLANELAVSLSTVNRWKNGNAAPHPAMRRPVYAALIRRVSSPNSRAYGEVQ